MAERLTEMRDEWRRRLKRLEAVEEGRLRARQLPMRVASGSRVFRHYEPDEVFAGDRFLVLAAQRALRVRQRRIVGTPPLRRSSCFDQPTWLTTTPLRTQLRKAESREARRALWTAMRYSTRFAHERETHGGGSLRAISTSVGATQRAIMRIRDRSVARLLEVVALRRFVGPPKQCIFCRGSTVGTWRHLITHGGDWEVALAAGQIELCLRYVAATGLRADGPQLIERAAEYEKMARPIDAI
jgi:hypothetical protein